MKNIIAGGALAAALAISGASMAQDSVQYVGLAKSKVAYQFTSGIVSFEVLLEKLNDENTRLLVKKGSKVLLDNRLVSVANLFDMEQLHLSQNSLTGAYALSMASSRDVTDVCEGDSDVISAQERIEVQIGSNDALWRVDSWSDDCAPVFSEWSSKLDDEFSYADAVQKHAQDPKRSE